MTTAEKVEEISPEKSEGNAVEKNPEKRRALGRGLDSLLPGRPRAVNPGSPIMMPARDAAESGPIPKPSEASAWNSASDSGMRMILLDAIDANPYQTRQTFDERALSELAESIKTSGLAQPIVVRTSSRDRDRYVLVLGERRCRATKIAGKTEIPAIVRAMSEEQAAEITIIENMQRQDLNCMEQANAFARLSREFGLTQEQIGQRVGVSRESVANYMRLLKLPPSVQNLVTTGKLGFSEARVLLQLPAAEEMKLVAEAAVRQGLSVAALQDFVEGMSLPKDREVTSPPAHAIDPNVRAAQTELERILGVRVKIKDRKGKGTIVIQYSNLEDFDRVLEMLGSKA